MFLQVAALLCLAGCTPAVVTSPTGLRTITLRTADGDRTATVHRGASAAAGAPLVVVLHGAGGTAVRHAREPGLGRARRPRGPGGRLPGRARPHLERGGVLRAGPRPWGRRRRIPRRAGGGAAPGRRRRRRVRRRVLQRRDDELRVGLRPARRARRDRAGRGRPDRRLPGAGAADRRGRARDPRRAGAGRGRPRTVRRDVPLAGRLARPVPDRRRLPDDRRPRSTPRPPGSTRGRAPGTPW